MYRGVSIMKHKSSLLICLLFCMLFISFSACSQHSYDEEWIIGKTSAEIEARYGMFDRLGMEYHEDGMLYSANAGYIISESTTGFFGRSTEKLFVVHFNGKGIADSCKIAPGNWGG